MKFILTGVTGMVGEGVLHECLQRSDIHQVLLLNRKPSGISHPKVQELIVRDFYDLSDIENKLGGYDSCLFCLGTTSVGKTNEEFYKISYTLTMSVANTLVKMNPNMTFCYISGKSTDSTEKGSVAWARTKGKTENDLMKLPFKRVYNFRPSYLHPTPGMKNTLSYYKYVSWMYPFFKLIMPNSLSKLSELGQAMVNACAKGYEKQIIEVEDILVLAKG
ncbi:MAG: NAD-dependent epimerase/dehydratase family protein [Leadbetterella sp.]